MEIHLSLFSYLLIVTQFSSPSANFLANVFIRSWYNVKQYEIQLKKLHLRNLRNFLEKKFMNKRSILH